MKKKAVIQKQKSTDTTLWIAITGIVILGGAAYLWYRKRKENNEDLMLLDTADATSERTPKTVVRSRFRCANTQYPLEYGTCHADVELLQRYLKIYNEDLGRSGKNKDGVDGKFGSKTVKAARKRLGKDAFTKEDIEGMKLSLKMIKS
ncbi:peptidoglycan-binding domain-containing protein [Aquimarina macrocephali]|uniref:peptidoglycan-binding domain-containing protein n=1 Tax=Aquimarina macrocephali TaxID=666563 RepID=UPI00046571B7|nr:peptidoglycan-binding domain-containing protein [Aquimarina macrocephali]